MATVEELEQLFRERGIDFANPGFYDGAAFQIGEREDPRFLEDYGEYVHVRPFDKEYLDRARAIILGLAEFLNAELVADGRTGACIDASGALMRMLEREGVWSCMVAGATTVSFPPRKRPESPVLPAGGASGQSGKNRSHVDLCTPIQSSGHYSIYAGMEPPPV